MNNLNKEAILIHKILLKNGLENPLIHPQIKINISTRKKLISKYISKIMYLLNLDIKNSNIIDTPKRIMKMYIEEIFLGLNYSNFPKVTFIKNKIKLKDIITIRKIRLTSMCEHHFVIIDGEADIAYIPNKKIIGLSNIGSITNFFAARPQIQERLTKQILITLQTLLGTKNVAVSINAIHHCIKLKGCYDKYSSTNTLSLGGIFRSSESMRREFLFNTRYKK